MINHTVLVVCIASACLIGISTRPSDKSDQEKNKNLVALSVEELSLLDWADDPGNRQKIEKEAGIWYYAGMQAVDSISFNHYLSALVNVRGDYFSDLSSTDGLEFTEQLTLYGAQMKAPTIIQVYLKDKAKNSFIISSTANPEALFVSDSTGLYKRIFTDLRKYWPHGQ